MKFFQKITILILTGVFSCLSGFSAIYEAETAVLYKAVTETKNSGFSGASYVNFDNEKGSYLEVKTGMKLAGEQNIIIRFANGTSAARPMKIELNNSIVSESFAFEPTGSWTNWDTLSIKTVFNKGINSLRFTSMGDEGGPNIDFFDVSGEQAPTHRLHLTVNGNGEIIQIPTNELLFEGEEITLFARPDFNSIFKNWSGDYSSEDDTLSFFLETDKNIQANFIEIEIQLPEPDFSMIGYAAVNGNGVETTTGGKNGKITVVENLAQLISWGASREDNYSAETLIIKGKIEAESTEVITIKRGKDISILGDSNSNGGFAELKNISLNIRDYSNVIVRNLKIHEVLYPNDDLTIDGCHHVWIDHCEFHSLVGNGIGYDTYDGLLDIKKGSYKVTVSWCYFHDHMKTVLIGHSDNNGDQDVNLEVTMHHNWFSNTDGRNPSLRFGKIHYFNNYLENIGDYGFAVRNGAHAKIENCHFENVKLPVASDKFTGHGFACVSGCIYSGSTNEADNEILPPFDCEFWETQIPYDYQLENTNTVSISVKEYAGVGKIELSTEISNISEISKFQLEKISFNKYQEKLNVFYRAEKEEFIDFYLFSVDGKIIATNRKICLPGNQNIQFELPSIKPGIYIANFSTGLQHFNQKLYIQ